MTIGRLNHVGVATPSIDESIRLYRDVMGATRIHDRFAMPEQGVWVCFVDLPNSQIEDVGWGCMIRVIQMMMAQAISRNQPQLHLNHLIDLFR